MQRTPDAVLEQFSDIKSGTLDDGKKLPVGSLVVGLGLALFDYGSPGFRNQKKYQWVDGNV